MLTKRSAASGDENDSRLEEHMGILFAHARDEILSSTPFVIFERAAAGFQTGDLRCDKDVVKRDERL